MTHQVTIKSVRRTLDEQGSRCPIDSCGSDDFRVTFQPSTQDDCGREHFVCNSCTAEWSVYLYPAKLESIMLPGGNRYDDDVESSFERGALRQMACPKDPVVSALKELLLQMKRGSTNGKGEALAKLAFLARVDLNSLPDIQPAEPQGPLSGTE